MHGPQARPAKVVARRACGAAGHYRSARRSAGPGWRGSGPGVVVGPLAYDNPAWTLASGTASAVREPESLVPDWGSLPEAVAAVHQACHTLTLLGQIEQERIRAASRAGSILVPT